jgi:hypothetical protein
VVRRSSSRSNDFSAPAPYVAEARIPGRRSVDGDRWAMLCQWDNPFLAQLICHLSIARERLHAEDSQFNRCAYVCNVFSAIEGVHAVIADALRLIGLPRVRDRLHFWDTLTALVTRYAAERGDTEQPPLLATPATLDVPRHVRNRIAHPRQDLGLEVSDRELQAVCDLDAWILQVADMLQRGAGEERGEATIQLFRIDPSARGVVFRSFGDLYQRQSP